MVDVTHNNFCEWYPEIERAITEACFVAIDFEFLGIPTSDDSVSLFDTMEERYRKNSECVKKFPPCQMGLACFRENEQGTCYEVEIFSLAVFKRMSKKVFSFSLPALKFLAKHKFDFNKFIAEGITYSNRTEIAKLKKEICSGDIDYDVFCDGLDHRLQMLKLRVLEEARETQDSSSDDVQNRYPYRRGRGGFRGSESAGRQSGSSLHLYHPILIELSKSRRSECGAAGDAADVSEPLWDRELTPVEAAAVVYVLSEEHPNCDFQMDHTRTLLYCAEQPLMFRAMKDTAKRSKVVLKNLLWEISGIAEIVHLISEKKVPLVAHNSFLDLMYLYHCFEADLPDSYVKWKKCVHTCFPVVIDTKVLAATVQDKLRERGVTDLSLQTLGNYFDSPSCGEILPFRTPPINGGPHSQAIFAEGEHYHNAAFDALMTGEVFVKLSYLFAYTRSAGQADFRSPWPLRKLLFACRTEIGNRIPVPLIDNLYCSLTGDDPVGNRPDVVCVLRRRDLPYFLHDRLRRGWVGRFLLQMMDMFCRNPTTSEDDADDFRQQIRQRFGSHRVDARRSRDGRGVMVATNSPNTFVKMCTWVALNELFRLPPHLESKSFEERLVDSGRGRRRRKRGEKGAEREGETQSWGGRVKGTVYDHPIVAGLGVGSVLMGVMLIGWRTRTSTCCSL